MASKSTNHPFDPFKNKRMNFDAISTEVDNKNIMKEIEKVIEEKRKDIFDILSTSRADWNNNVDEKSLKKMKDALDKKKKALEEHLWEVTTDLNLLKEDNSDLVNYCKSILAPDTETPDIALAWECRNLLSTLQEIYTKWSRKEKLFSGKKDDASDDFADLIEPDVFSDIINAVDEATLQTKIDEFVKKTFSPRNNSFGISKSKLYTSPVEQAKVATRIAIFLHCMQKALKEWRINKIQAAKVKSILKKLKDEQIPKIRWIYNLKKEKEAIDAEYETLLDIRNNDITDINWTSTTTNIDLTDSFEGKSTGKAQNIDFYNLDKNKVEVTIGPNTYTANDIVLKDSSWETSELNKMIGSSWDYTLSIKIAWSEIKLWELCINYSDPKKALFILKADPNIASKVTWDVNIKIPIMAVKKVTPIKNTGQVSLTRNIKIDIKWTTPPPPPPPWPTTKKPKEWSATISSVKNIHSEEAAYLAEEKDREDFDKLWELSLFKLGTWHPWERIKHFISREYKRDKAIKKHMQAVKWKIDIRRESVVNAANRHELEYSDDKWKWKINNIQTHYNADVNRLCVEYLKTDMKDADFEKKFNEIISHDLVIGEIIKNNEMNYLWSNILLKLKQERAEQIMMDKIWKLLLKDVNADVADLEMKDTYNESTFKSELQTISDEYFNATQSNFPSEIRELLNNSSDKDLMLPILKNWKAQLQANVKNLKMQLQLLDNTTGAYEINNKDKEKALWQRFWNWMDKHRILTIWGSALAGTGLLYLGSSIVWWPIGAWLATGLLALKMWVITAAKKASHYTKEQKGQEKRLTHGLNIEKQNMENIRKVMNWAPWYSWRKYKAKRQYQLYQEATQQKIADTEYLTKKIQSVLSSTANLDALENKNEKDILEWYLIDALVRLDYYKECGHNFVASQNRTKIEQDFNSLYKAVQDGVFRLNESKLSSTNPRKNVIKDGIDGIRTGDPRYSDLYNALKKDYTTSLATFKKRRWSLERRYWITSAFIYWWSAWLMQRILWSWINWHHVDTIHNPPTSSSTLHSEVKRSLMHNGVSPTKITAIENALKSTPTSWWSYNPEAFWTIVKNETWWTDVQLNNWVSKWFMKDVLRRLNEWWTSEFKNALLSSHINTLRPWDPLFVRAETFLSSPRIGILKPWEWSTVLRNLQDYLSWAKSYNSFTPDMRIKMWHFGHMAIHNDIGMWSKLTEELLNTVSTPWSVKIVEWDKRYFFDGIGMPFYANTYRKKLVPKDEEEWVMLENSDPGEIPEGDELITADPTWTTWWPSSGSAPSWI